MMHKSTKKRLAKGETALISNTTGSPGAKVSVTGDHSELMAQTKNKVSGRCKMRDKRYFCIRMPLPLKSAETCM